MIGYCGINCNNCLAYKATVNNDLALLEKAAGSFQNGAYPAQDWVCLGCQPADQPFLAKFCAKCEIRLCAIGRKIENCAACTDFENCTQLHEFIKSEPEDVTRRMMWLRECFLDRQLEKDN